MKLIQLKLKLKKTYHDNGKIETEFEVINKVAHGQYKTYQDNGQLKSTIQFENAHKVDGVVNSYNEE